MACRVNSLAWPAYSVKEMFNEQFFFEQIPSIILGILRFDPTPDFGYYKLFFTTFAAGFAETWNYVCGEPVFFIRINK